MLNIFTQIGGQASGNGHSGNPSDHIYGSEVDITASPDSHYEFTGWAGDGVEDPNSLSTKVVMSEDRNITATFKLKEYNITIKTYPEGVGSVSGSGTGFNHGSIANISATVPFGYEFSHWDNFNSDGIPTTGLDNNESETTTLTVGGGHILFANFNPLPFDISVNSTIGGNATIVESSPYYYDQAYTISASSEYGYTFQSWTSSTGSESLLSSANSKISAFTVAGNASYTANFTENKYRLTVTMGQGGASISPSIPSLYNHSDIVAINATPLEGYEFVKWKDDNGALQNFTEHNTTAIMANNLQDVLVEAQFSPKKYDVIINSTPGGQAHISGGNGPWEHFETYFLSAVPNSGYSFKEWSGSDFSLNSLVKSNTHSENELAITGAVELTANFELIDYNITVTSSNEGGSASGGGIFTIEDTPEAQAVANTGWHFTHWSGDTFALNSNSTLTSSILLSENPQDLSITANFAKNGYTIDVSTHGNGLVNSATNLSLSPLFQDLISLNASSNAGWEFDRWYGYSFSDPTNPNVEFNATSNLDLNATFKRKTFNLSINTSPYGTSNGSGIYEYESNVTISTLPHTGYNFTGWTGDIAFLTNSNSTSTNLLIPDQNVSLTPTFSPKTYQITATADENGTVIGGGSYSYGSITNIIPTGKVDSSNIHSFAGWIITNDDGQQSLRSDNPLKLLVDGNYTVFAQFEILNLDHHVLDINSSIEGAGQIYNDLSLRSWNAGTSSLTSVISAYPNPGYSFIGWQNPNNKSLSPSFKSPTITFTTDSNASLIATFKPVTQSISTRSSGNGNIINESNESLISLSALPDANNNFSHWEIDKNFTYSVSLGKSSIDGVSDVYYINGKESPVLTLMKGYTYFFDCNLTGHDFYLSTDMGSTGFSSEFTDANLSGSRTSNGTLTFTVPNNYDINQILYYCSSTTPYIGNKVHIIEQLSDSLIIPFPNQNTISPQISHDLALHGLFNLNSHDVTITALTGGNILTGSNGNYDYGTSINLVAEVSEHFTFSHWEGANFSDENNISTTATIMSDTQINAVFEPILYPLTLSKNIRNAGDVFTTNNLYQFPYGTVVSIQAITNSGYIFTNWDNGDTNSSTTITTDTNTSLTANYSRKPATVNLAISTLDYDGKNFSQSSGGLITPSAVTGKKVGETIELTASDNTGFQFQMWSIDNNQTIATRNLNIEVDENQTISAIFKRLSYNVNLTWSR